MAQQEAEDPAGTTFPLRGPGSVMQPTRQEGRPQALPAPAVHPRQINRLLPLLVDKTLALKCFP